jgi:cytochrome c biogenesis protein
MRQAAARSNALICPALAQSFMFGSACAHRLTVALLRAVLAKDLQQVVFYDSDGQFVGARRPGSGKPQQVEEQWFIIDEIIGASGMQMKHDPGTWIVYTGFGFLMITAFISYTSHSQVWALQDGDDVHVGGKSNRALVGFSAEYDRVLEAVPERSATGSGT